MARQLTTMDGQLTTIDSKLTIMDRQLNTVQPKETQWITNLPRKMN